MFRLSPSGPLALLLASLIFNDSSVPGNTVKDALDNLLMSGNSFPYTVGPIGIGNYQTIQSAIDAAESNGSSGVNNAVILILGGQWNESIVLNSGGIILVGAGFNQVYILGSVTFNWPTQSLGVYSINNIRVNGLVTHQTSGGVGTKRFTTNLAYLAGGISFATDVNWESFGSNIFRPTVDGIPAITGTLSTYALRECNLSLTGGAALSNIVIDCTTISTGNIFGGTVFGISNQINGGFRANGIKNWEVSAEITPLVLNTGMIRAAVSNNSFLIQAVSTAPVIIKNGGGILHQGGNIWMGQGAGPSPMIQVNAGSVINGIPIT